MENTPEQNVNLEEIVEFEDDDVNTMEEKEVLEGEDATDHVIEDSMIEALPEPYVGMEFESPDDAQEYYNKYARFIGFGTRKNRLMRSRSNQAIIGQEFVCSKEGVRAKKYVNREDRIKKSIPDETREGWKAMLRISKKEEQKWVISGFYAAHNHELATPKSTPLIRSHRKRSRVQKDLMDVLADSGVRPIITDQDGSITSAIAKVLPNSTHHFCMWHIEKKFPENLSQVYHQNADFKKEFNNCIHNTVTRDDFEDAWMKVIQKYKLQEALENRYAKEREKNFKTMDSKPVLKTLYSMEAEASQIYTRKLFRMFQDELVHTQEYVADRVNVDGDSKTDGNSKTDGDSKTYKVHEVNREKPVYLVTFDATLNEVECNCHKFEFMGILCRHALTIFIKKRVFSLPQRNQSDPHTINATEPQSSNQSADVMPDACKTT
ncbi:hypothetical protein COLO4_18553 [Corchorus olitorius]|uniref:Protein FAR1-RELATED SEQUENCE n=1 Tax=Corchorus olitorius TaxID=93759 RepID=A0A1R3J8K5_9ROSI|nr:hypothetical protein COLO4_18553 [Corchorus olitorius]